jgi:hypothetical protein
VTIRSDAVVAFRTGLLHEADMVADALERAGVPHYRQVEAASGLTFAMPIAPVQGPGAAWLVLIPQKSAARARQVIRRLPVSDAPSPGMWGFQPRPEVKRFYKQYAWVFIVAFSLALLWDLIQLFRP